MSNSLQDWLTGVYVVFAFCSALCLGALKSLLVGPIAGLILIIGNVGVILGLFPAHVLWTVYALVKTNRFDAPLKVAFLFALPALFGIWLGLSIAGSVLVGVGYGFFTPWVSAFEAFRHDNQSNRFFHCIVDGTWGTIRGSCTVVRDFADICYHSYPLYLKELRESPASLDLQPFRFIHVPGCIIVGLLGLVVEIPFYTAIAIVKSPYMLFKGWYRLTHDLISREGPFLETACIPIAGLTILMWPLVVIGSIIMAIFSSFFIGVYGAVVVYQERSFRRGVAYVIAMVAEFDEYTNDWLYLREGSVLPKPKYRKKKGSEQTEFSVRRNRSIQGKLNAVFSEAPAMLVPSLTASRSVREAIQEVKMVQVFHSFTCSSFKIVDGARIGISVGPYVVDCGQRNMIELGSYTQCGGLCMDIRLFHPFNESLIHHNLPLYYSVGLDPEGVGVLGVREFCRCRQDCRWFGTTQTKLVRRLT